MGENCKILINGKEIKLNEEDKEYLLSKYSDSNIFNIGKGETYYFIDSTGAICTGHSSIDDIETGLYSRRDKSANVCKDSSVLGYRAMNETLNRLLWRFSYQNGWNRDSWTECRSKCYVVYEAFAKYFEIRQGNQDTRVLGAVYFTNEEIASKAIKEVIKPFYEKYPELLRAQ